MDAGARPGWAQAVRGFLGFLKILLGVVLVVLAMGVAWLLLPPTAAPLPAGAARLQLATQPSGFGARVVLGCPAAAFPDLRVAADASSMFFLRVGGSGGAEDATGPGGRIDPIWPAGWSAWLLHGRAVLVDPEGGVVARDGDVIRGLGGGSGRVCLTIGARPVVQPGGG